MLVFALGIIGLVAFSGFFWDVLAIRKVVIEGGERITSDDVQRLIDVEIGDNILTADLNAVRQRLQVHPWVRSTTVERRYPNVHISFQERLPYAVVATSENSMMWCDEEGYVLYPFSNNEQEQDTAFIEILGLGTINETVYGPRVGSDHQWGITRMLVNRFRNGIPELAKLQFFSTWVDVTTSLKQRIRLPLTGAESALRQLVSIWSDLENRVSFTTLDLRFEGEFVYEGTLSQ
jgi:hypothetical protein